MRKEFFAMAPLLHFAHWLTKDGVVSLPFSFDNPEKNQKTLKKIFNGAPNR